MLSRNGKHVLVAYIMKPKAGYDYLATAAHFAAESSTGTNVNVCTTDDFTKSVDALVYYIDPDNEEMKIAYPNLLFDRNITDGRAMMCSFLTLAIGNNQGNLAIDSERTCFAKNNQNISKRITNIHDYSRLFLFSPTRKLMVSSAQISSGVCRCGSQDQVPEEKGSGGLGSGRFRRVPVCAGGSGGWFRKIPEGSGVRWCKFRKQVPEGSGVCWCRFRRQVPEGSGRFRCVLV